MFGFILLSVIILLASFFVPGGTTGAGWTLYPPQSISAGTPGAGMGIILMLVSLAVFIVAATMGGLNYVTTVLQARCKGMTLDAYAFVYMGHLHGNRISIIGFSCTFGECNHDDFRYHNKNEFLHASDDLCW